MKLSAFTLPLIIVVLSSSCAKDLGDEKLTATVASNQGGGGIDPGYVPPLFERLSTKYLSAPRLHHAAAGIQNKVVFAGGIGSVRGSTVNLSSADIFDVTTLARTTANLSQARHYLAAAAAGNKIVFAGGMSSSGVSKVVDIYDAVSNTWTSAQLSEARYNIAAAAAGNKIVFAGGLKSGNVASNKADIYDVVTNTWTTAQLVLPAKQLKGAAAGNKIVFADVMENNQGILGDVYDVTTNSWSLVYHQQFTFARAEAAAGAHDKVIFLAAKAFSYNVNSSGWTTSMLSASRDHIGAGSIGEYILFAGGYDGYYMVDGIDVCNAKTGNWFTLNLAEARAAVKLASAKNRIFIGGGGAANSSSDVVEIFQLNKRPALCTGCF